MANNNSKKTLSRSVGYAIAKAKESGAELPPGELVNMNEIEWTDRLYMLRQSQEVGPIFKTLIWDELCICMVGLPLCQRFLKENDDRVVPQTMELRPLVPKGFMRQMEGETHQHYRKALMMSLSSAVMTINQEQHEQTVRNGLHGYFMDQDTTPNKRDLLVKWLNEISSGLLIQIFFGARYNSETFNHLLHLYHELGPNGLVWNIEDKQKVAFENIRHYLRKQLAEANISGNDWLPESILANMHEVGGIDDTLLGNLIYMVEMGRYDIYTLFRWLIMFATENTDLIEEIAEEPEDQSNNDTSLTKAFVLETLRMEQSGRLLRDVKEDIEFDGFLIPKYATVRLCLWESHKEPSTFSDPFDFNPKRFLENKYSVNEFAPFGMGKHLCPLGDVANRMSALLIKVLAKHYCIQSTSSGPAMRGVYHWEPAYTFAAQLKKKTEQFSNESVP